MRRMAAAGMLAFTLLAAGCGERAPLRIGFLAGLSGRVADLGEAGRNGAQIAVDEVNRAGGIGGRRVELVVRDDGHQPAQAIAAANELIAGRVEAVIGPMTSAMAEVIQPLAERSGMVFVSPTVTARKFFGVDDPIFLVMSSTREEAEFSAVFHRERGVRRMAVIYDTRNRAYTESWLAEFAGAFQQSGGDVVPVVFESAPDADLEKIAGQALEVDPDGVMLIASAVDAARLAQKIRDRDAKIVVAASQWATTERLIELGGQAVEGMLLHNYFDVDSPAPGLAHLRAVYRERFRREPGFAGVAAFDATRALLAALAKRQPGESLRQALLTRGPFPGAEGEFSFDRYGDSGRTPHIATVRDGRFAGVR